MRYTEIGFFKLGTRVGHLLNYNEVLENENEVLEFF